MKARIAVAALAALTAAVAMVALRQCPRRSGKPAGAAVTAPAGPTGVTRRKDEPRTASLSGVVVSSTDRKPIAGAAVMVEATNEDLGPPGAAPRSATSDAQGQWRVDGLARGAHRVLANAQGFLPSKRRLVDLGKETPPVEIVLGPGGHRLSGIVSDIGGGGISGAVVTVDGGVSFAAAAATNERGEYSLSVAPGNLHVSASHDLYASASRQVRVDGDKTFDLQLIPAGIIHGTVVTGDPKRPVADAAISFRGTEAGDPFKGIAAAVAPVRSAADGSFTLTGVEAGDWELVASTDTLLNRNPLQLSLGVAETVNDIELVVSPARTISGRVVRKDDPKVGIEGVRVSRMSIKLAQHNPKVDVAVALARTPASGEFRVAVPGSGMQIVAAAVGGGNSSTLQVMVGDTDVTGVELALDLGRTISGRVVSGEDATVTVKVDQVGLALAGDYVSPSAARTDEDHRFTLSGVPAAAQRLVARTDGGEVGSVSIAEGTASVDNVEIRVEPRPRVEGVVVDGQRRPLPGMKVQLTMKGKAKERHSAYTDARGEFRILGLEPGAYLVAVDEGEDTLPWAREWEQETKVSFPLRRNAERTVDVGLQGMRGLTLVVDASAGAIDGHVVDERETPMPDVWVSARRSDDKFSFGGPDPVLTDDQGAFRIGGLRGEVYDLVANHPPTSSYGQQRGVKPGTPVTVRLARSGSIHGIVTRGGTPLPLFEVNAIGQVSRQVWVDDPGGGYRIDRLPPGEYTVRAVADGVAGSAKVVVAPGGDTERDLAIETCSLRGRLVSARDGKPLAGWRVIDIPGQVDAGHRSRASDEENAEILTAMNRIGQAPATDAAGNFSGNATCGTRILWFVQSSRSFIPRIVAMAKATLVLGRPLDLGTVHGVEYAHDKVGGDLGVDTMVKPAQSGNAAAASAAAGGEDQLWISLVRNPGQAAGVMAGDQVMSVGGIEVQRIGARMAAHLLSPMRVGPGEVVRLVVRRGTVERSVDLTAVGHNLGE